MIDPDDIEIVMHPVLGAFPVIRSPIVRSFGSDTDADESFDAEFSILDLSGQAADPPLAADDPVGDDGESESYGIAAAIRRLARRICSSPDPDWERLRASLLDAREANRAASRAAFAAWENGLVDTEDEPQDVTT